MAQIKKKFITNGAVDGDKLKLLNNQYLKARNFADSGDVDLWKVDVNDRIVAGGIPQCSSDPSANNDLTRKSWVLSQISAAGSWSWQTAVLSIETTPPSPSEGDRYLIGPSGATDEWLGKENNLTEYKSSAWTFVAPINGMAVDVIDVTDGLYLYLGGAWAKKGFEATTASAGLQMSGNDVQTKLEASNPSLQVVSTELGVKLDGAGAIVKGSGGIAVALESSNPSLAIASNKLGAKLDGAGAIISGASGLAVQLESSDPSLQIASNKLGAKIDGSTIKKGASGLYSYTFGYESLTLDGTDITNQYKDLAVTIAPNSLVFSVDGILCYLTDSYTLSTVGGKTRITFVNDLATGGASALIEGDKIRCSYATIA